MKLGEIKIDKNELRKEIFSAREKLSNEYREEAEKVIYQKLFALEEFQQANTIMVFYSTEDEFNSHPIIERAWQEGKKVGIPRVYPKRVMEALEYTPQTQLEKSSFGISEPIQSSPIIKASDIDLIIMPCVTCNNQGERLGYGGGYYDRYLQRTNNPHLILPFYALLQRNNIPMEEHDQLVDVVITEEGSVHL
ncbi:5-formyltetrahydrofolate cyclo-ligase [Facklamia lactis]|uniref:5-formyltetrahydrofolate cyclo-ligase n=1 Tax=Facklamia lactis TaxID=2749967 RepID=UPI0018CFE3F1|nr:5-formyltetrahydrofolate cyclo-ligase [Facklamia lactis]MBG9979998.1 5-formyltetrahydrofolate cyclo-ligase [Facklamia lactis]